MMTTEKLLEALMLAFQLKTAGVPEEQIPIYSITEMRKMLQQIQQQAPAALSKAAKKNNKLTRFSQFNNYPYPIDSMYTMPFYNNPTSDKYVPPEAAMPISEIEDTSKIAEPSHDLPSITEEDKIDTASDEIESMSPTELAKKIEKIVGMMGEDGVDEHLAAAAAKLTARLLKLLEEIAGIKVTNNNKESKQDESAAEDLAAQAANMRARLLKTAQQAAALQLPGLPELLHEGSNHCLTIMKNSNPEKRIRRLEQQIISMLSEKNIRIARRNRGEQCLLRQRILDLLEEYGQMQSAGLAKKLRLPRRCVQRLLSLMKADGEVDTEDLPVFGRGRGRSGRLVLWKKPIPITAKKQTTAQATEVPINQACPRCGGQIIANQTEGFLFCQECGARYELNLQSLE